MTLALNGGGFPKITHVQAPSSVLYTKQGLNKHKILPLFTLQEQQDHASPEPKASEGLCSVVHRHVGVVAFGILQDELGREEPCLDTF